MSEVAFHGDGICGSLGKSPMSLESVPKNLGKRWWDHFSEENVISVTLFPGESGYKGCRGESSLVCDP